MYQDFQVGLGSGTRDSCQHLLFLELGLQKPGYELNLEGTPFQASSSKSLVSSGTQISPLPPKAGREIDLQSLWRSKREPLGYSRPQLNQDSQAKAKVH